MRAGIDEVGTGSLAGPCAVAVVVIKEGVVPGLRDSKLVEEVQRYELARQIRKAATFYHVAMRDSKFIDRKGIGRAWFECVRDCVEEVTAWYQDIEIVADQTPNLKYARQLPQVRFCPNGDDNVYEIQAASLVAKATRDRWMCQAAVRFPNYGFQQHKGYATEKHAIALEKHGPCSIHRLSWKKCRPDPNRNSLPVDLGLARTWLKKLVPMVPDSPHFSDWERKFIVSVDGSLQDGRLTEKQMGYIAKVYNRVFKRMRRNP